MNANGPAIWGGCVSAPNLIFFFSYKFYAVRNGVLFAVFALRIRQLAEKEGMVQILLSITRVVVQV